jgi:hypothetical protein
MNNRSESLRYTILPCSGASSENLRDVFRDGDSIAMRRAIERAS